jgi:hypothetical protein
MIAVMPSRLVKDPSPTIQDLKVGESGYIAPTTLDVQTNRSVYVLRTYL